MRILFICSSLEPGKDGVGDYTRRLGEELAIYGHEIALVALTDKHLSHGVVTNKEGVQSNFIQSVRIPYRFGKMETKQELTKLITSFQPQWISLQYVPYGFQQKGLPFYLPSLLAKACPKSVHWHFMFHEIWVGISVISPVKHKITGFAQRFIVKNLVRGLQPKLMSTSNRLYQRILEKYGLQAELLPLFSNIPMVSVSDSFTADFFSLLDILPEDRNCWKVAGIFGSLYPQANLAAGIQDLLQEVTASQKKLAIASLGRIGEDGKAEWDRLQLLFSTQVRFVLLGEQTEESISQLFQLFDVGISCTPAQHIGKSGVYAAMKLHNLPVLLPASEHLPEYNTLVTDAGAELERKASHEFSVRTIAETLLTQLKQSLT